ncbi:hypothetical protein K431DRAFT_289229 [Polychaeton citri CBS 116435]|uniref:Sas10 C-terminal domain-containing protein n=1 Tax=Polychaeton citri CBS 116435 TaxID=1314669 RepID=A0A9P4Q206_9PEZI|nr:hypothetical protein K431DRAFT_289229 [Polychaeton citri CBS 116435]
MGKKRKASGHNEGRQSGPNLEVGQSKRRISTFEDVADSDDDFHLNRDKVLLDEAPDAKRRRKWQEEEEFLQPSDEEVLDYSESEDEEDSEDDGGVALQDRESDVNEVESDGQGKQESEDGEEGWGTTRKDVYGADAIETEEQATEEEAEARRLQRKQLQAMSAADYGFDESEWQDEGKAKAEDKAKAGQAVITEVLPQLQIDKDMSAAEKLKLLKSRYPEFEPLSKELFRMEGVYKELEARQAAHGLVDGDVTRNIETKMQAAAAYRGALSMYFALLTSTASDEQADALAMAPIQLREHPIMDTLFKCRELWSRADGIPFVAPGVSKMEVSSHLFGDNGNEGSSDAEYEKLEVQPNKQTKSRRQRHADVVVNAEAARKAEQLKRTEAGLADLNDLIGQRSSKKRKSKQSVTDNGGDSDIGEEAPLTAQEAADKAKHKKSLRFYTSQIAQKANKRGAAGRNAGGDDDIPYRERLKDRQARLNIEAEARARKPAQNGEELGGESDEEDYAQARKIRGEGEGAAADSEDDYYDMVAARSSKKKSDKAALAEAQKKAALQGGQVVQEETVGTDGKRKISYLIEKNRGLTPHRKKDVRNPRVKKRKKYDEKKKKLSSIKPVYKGGEGRGGYGGEMTGIKKGLVKSTKL